MSKKKEDGRAHVKPTYTVIVTLFSDTTIPYTAQQTYDSLMKATVDAQTVQNFAKQLPDKLITVEIRWDCPAI